MNIVFTVFAFTVVLGIIVLVHEFGHYIAARIVGVKVETFSFGMGKRIVGKKIGDTDFRISLFPIGGYVKLSGEDDFENSDPKPYDFHSKNRGQKIFILLMGPLMNVILALLILTVVNITGVEIESYKLDPAVIGLVEKDSPAEKAGLKHNDLILEVNGNRIKNWKDLELEIGSNPDSEIDILYRREGRNFTTIAQVKGGKQYNIGEIGIFWDFKVQIYKVLKDSPAFRSDLKEGDIILKINENKVNPLNVFNLISKNPGKELKMEIERFGKKLLKSVIPEKNEKNIGKIGVQLIKYSPLTKVKYGLIGSVNKSINDIYKLTTLVFNAFKKMILGKLSPKNLSGPIEIAKFSQKAMASGFSDFFMLIAFISLQLGIVNLFPIPALDGGHMMIYSIEALIRKEFSVKIKAALINTGFLLLLLLMAFVILNDVAKALPNGWGSILPF